jgi:adhesin/invasin
MGIASSSPVRLAVLGALLAGGCDGATTLLAPTGAILTLTSTTSALSFNGNAAVSARVLTSQGQPVPDGTLVTFSTTLGTVAPSEVPTAAGVATTTFTAGSASGTAIVTASSGGVGGGDGVRIAIGVAAVSRVQLTATPATIPFGGGTSSVAALVVDASNNPLVGIPVTFSTPASGSGTVVPTSLKTDPTGIAQTVLTASQGTTVTATANAAPSDPGFGGVGAVQGSVTLATGPRPVPVVTIAPSANPLAQTPTTFTIGAVPAPGTNTTIASVTVDFGDGTRTNLGAVSGTAIAVQHVFANGGSFTVTAEATDSAGGSATAVTVVSIGFQPPASVRIVADAMVPIPPANTKSLVTLTATLAPATIIGGRYVWTFGDGSTETTTVNQVQHEYDRASKYVVRVEVTPLGSAQVVTGTATIVVP